MNPASAPSPALPEPASKERNMTRSPADGPSPESGSPDGSSTDGSSTAGAAPRRRRRPTPLRISTMISRALIAAVLVLLLAVVRSQWSSKVSRSSSLDQTASDTLTCLCRAWEAADEPPP